MTALYLERYMNFGLSLEELQSDRPIIGIAQTGSDLSPCNRHHLVLADRLREGIREAGGIAIEFPVHPIQETGKRPTAGLDRNLAYLGLVETLFGYPLDGTVLTIGCDKTTPACLMAAATVNIPAIALSVGPMLNGWFKGERTGSGTIVWKARELLATGEIDYKGFISAMRLIGGVQIAIASTPSPAAIICGMLWKLGTPASTWPRVIAATNSKSGLAAMCGICWSQAILPTPAMAIRVIARAPSGASRARSRGGCDAATGTAAPSSRTHRRPWSSPRQRTTASPSRRSGHGRRPAAGTAHI